MMRLVPLVLILGLAGCGARDYLLDIAHRDRGPVAADVFPQDDAICRSYGLRPGTRDYARCRDAKAHVRRLTKEETDYGFLRNPILPDLR